MRYSLFILSISLMLLSCGQNNNTKTKTEDPSSPDTSSAKTEQAEEKPAAETYNIDKHDDINFFISDLAKAVTANDKNGIAQMIVFPLADEFGDNNANQSTPLGCKNADEFFKKYDSIFVSPLKNAITAKKFRAADNSSKELEDVIRNGEYLIEYDPISGGNRPDIMLGIKKVSGKFKIYAIKFYS